MRTGNVLLSGPDYLRLMAVCAFLARRHGIEEPWGKALLTAAKLPGARAAAEKLTQAVVATLAGARKYTAAGALAGAETFSPVQMVIDREIVNWTDSFARPLDFSIEEFLLDEIQAVGPGGLFMDRDSTAARVRGAFWEPELFSVNAYPSWVAEGRPRLVEKARDTLNGLKLAEGPVVSPDRQKELAAIESRFMARL
jgi:trimethylamine:corrinoid methyltransferase-like protein